MTVILLLSLTALATLAVLRRLLPADVPAVVTKADRPDRRPPA